MSFRRAEGLSLCFLVAVVLLSVDAVGLKPTGAFAQSQTIDQIQAQIQSLLQQVQQLQAQLAVLKGEQGTIPVFSRNLTLGSVGPDVKNLQTALNSDVATRVAVSGVGSTGRETEFFGSLTKAAVSRFQEKYAAEILAPLNLTKGTGFVGVSTRVKLNALFGGTGGPEPTPGPAPVSSLSVVAGAQPNNALFPVGAARVPFTVLKFTAPFGIDVTVNSITVERTGFADDTVFSGVELLDEIGAQVGNSRNLNSNHRAILNEPFVVKAGQTRTMTIAGNAQTAASGRGGQIAGLSVVDVSALLPVTASLPITGASDTVNESLGIGSVSMNRGSLDPNGNTAKPVGTAGYVFSSVNVAAGSNEDVRLMSVRWNQSGSAAGSDLANVKTVVDGTQYGTVLSGDGKFYTAAFGNGIIIAKGLSKEISLRADISGGSGRTVDFDIFKNSDLYTKGESFGFGILPPITGSSGLFGATQPWFNGSVVTVSAGTLNVSKSNSVSAQNVAINVPDQVLGGFEAEVRGEDVSVANSVFNIQVTGTGGLANNITDIALVDQSSNNVIAGPRNAAGASLSGTVTFTDTITYPVGKKVYLLKGRLSAAFANNQTIIVSTTPGTQWTNVTGLTTGASITPAPSSSVTANTMTVKSGGLAINVSSLPLSQSVIAGSSQFLFANYVLDAGNSGEDVSLSALPLFYTAANNPSSLNNCRLYDGSIALTTGSDVVNPTVAGATNFPLDAPLVIPKGALKTISLMCDVSGNATLGNQFSWGISGSANVAATGKISGQSIVVSVIGSNGQAMTVSTSGAYSVADDSTQGYSIVAAGTSGVTLLRLKFIATTESVDIQRVELKLAGTASNTPLDLVNTKVALYDADNPTVRVGEVNFSTGSTAQSGLISPGNFRVPAGGSKTMLVKGDIAAISGIVGPLQTSGDLLKVAYDGSVNGLASGNYGRGVSSGQVVVPSSPDVTPTGVRIMKSFPVFAKVDLVSSERLLQSQSGKTLYKFKIAANNSGDIGVYKFTFNVTSGTVSAQTAAFGLYAFTDSGYSSADTTFSTDGLLNAGKVFTQTGTIVELFMNKGSGATTYKIPAGETRWFVLRADVTNVEAGPGTESITVQLDGDAAYPALGTLMGTAAGIDADTNNNFIWSPMSSFAPLSLTDLDFTNGFGALGLPGTNMASEILTSAN